MPATASTPGSHRLTSFSRLAKRKIRASRKPGENARNPEPGSAYNQPKGPIGRRIGGAPHGRAGRYLLQSGHADKAGVHHHRRHLRRPGTGDGVAGASGRAAGGGRALPRRARRFRNRAFRSARRQRRLPDRPKGVFGPGAAYLHHPRQHLSHPSMEHRNGDAAGSSTDNPADAGGGNPGRGRAIFRDPDGTEPAGTRQPKRRHPKSAARRAGAPPTDFCPYTPPPRRHSAWPARSALLNGLAGLARRLGYRAHILPEKEVPA